MAGDNDEVIITIDDDVLGEGMAGDVVVTKPEKAAAEETKPAKKADDADPIADLKSQFSTLQRTSQAAVTAAVRTATEASQRADKLEAEIKEQNSGSQYATVVAGIDAAEAEVEQAKKDYKAAFDAGDGTLAAEAQARIARSAARVERLTEAKADIELARTERQHTRRQPEQQSQPAYIDPVEAYVRGRTAPTADWIRKHPDFVTDTSKNAKLTAAHFDAVGEGIAVDSPEYFDHVEKFVGLKKQPAQEQQRQRRPSAPAAPVRHSGDGPSTNGAREVRLTRGEATAATDGTHVWNYDDPTGKNRWKKGDPIGVQEFARRKAAMESEGRYDRTYVSQ